MFLVSFHQPQDFWKKVFEVRHNLCFFLNFLRSYLKLVLFKTSKKSISRISVCLVGHMGGRTDITKVWVAIFFWNAPNTSVDRTDPYTAAATWIIWQATGASFVCVCSIHLRPRVPWGFCVGQSCLAHFWVRVPYSYKYSSLALCFSVLNFVSQLLNTYAASQITRRNSCTGLLDPLAT